MTSAAAVIILLYTEAAKREEKGDKAGAERLRIKPPTLRKWVQRGHITRKPDGSYDWRQILAYIDRRDTTMIKPVSITQHADGTATLLVEGKDISNSVAGLHIAVRAGDLARVTVSLSAALAYTGDAEVTVNPADAEALIALGWTPPAAAA